jgi:hypothetical protein
MDWGMCFERRREKLILRKMGHLPFLLKDVNAAPWLNMKNRDLWSSEEALCFSASAGSFCQWLVTGSINLPCAASPPQSHP